jgi:hypothetical protein
MAHYAKLDKNNIVIGVNVIDDNIEEDKGEKIIEWLINNFDGHDWKKTSYNTIHNTHKLGGVPFRKNYAGLGYIYNEEGDAFIPPQPFLSWELDTTSYSWYPPKKYPNDDLQYQWNENTLEWEKLSEGDNVQLPIEPFQLSNDNSNITNIDVYKQVEIIDQVAHEEYVYKTSKH